MLVSNRIKLIIKEDGGIEAPQAGGWGQCRRCSPWTIPVRRSTKFLDEVVKSEREAGKNMIYRSRTSLCCCCSACCRGFSSSASWFFISGSFAARRTGRNAVVLGVQVLPDAEEHTGITFTDVAGIEEAKEGSESSSSCGSPKKFQRLGTRSARILLVGASGCGKTLLAKAIAGEVRAVFSNAGRTLLRCLWACASRSRLFKQAKENSPCIIFLDEIEAVGRRRGASFGGGGHDEREQTLNAILVEMDGFDTNSQVIVIAATNRADVLDPALVRPGRFDRQVFVPLPDLQGRYEILKVHLRKIKLGPTLDIRRLARGTPMFSGGELSAMVNEAAIVATMNNKEFVDQEDLEEARDKVRWGRAKKSAVVDERDRRITAYHEAGHALIQSLEKDADPSTR